MSKVVVANDHGAVELTAAIVEFLKNRGFEVNYLGTAENKSVDYPDMAELACTEFLKGDYEFGVLCCGTGIGISISANKIHGIRCALPRTALQLRWPRSTTPPISSHSADASIIRKA